ncbi:hypothetical protein IMZ48_01590 [Candidatus Bathyarchaeota archaeon]|nr:hypothetical protein [Candidatus Bathyarchaeota archaeon]
MVRLWSGDIDSARGALQLLLLVDYICDWGRDKLRESTIRSLAALSRSNRQGTVASDIFSLRAATATPAPTLQPGAMDEMTATPVRPWTGPSGTNGMTKHMINTSKSGNVWLVQGSLHPAAENVSDGEEPVEHIPDGPTIFETPILINELESPVDYSGAVTNWAQGVSHEVIVVDSDDDEGGVDSVTGGPRDNPVDFASPEQKQEPARALSDLMLDGQELGDQNGAGERSSRPEKGARRNMGTLQAERVLPRRSKRISTGRRA